MTAKTTITRIAIGSLIMAGISLGIVVSHSTPAHANLTNYSVNYTTWCSSGCAHTATFTANNGAVWISEDCPSGEVAVGGGVASSTADSGLGLFASYAVNSGNEWDIGVNPTTTQATLTVEVACATVNNNL